MSGAAKAQSCSEINQRNFSTQTRDQASSKSEVDCNQRVVE